MNKNTWLLCIITCILSRSALAGVADDKAKLAVEEAKIKAAQTNIQVFEQSFMGELNAFASRVQSTMERCRKSTDPEECRRRCEELKATLKAMAELLPSVAPEEGRKATLSQAKAKQLQDSIEYAELPERLSRPFGYFNDRS